MRRNAGLAIVVLFCVASAARGQHSLSHPVGRFESFAFDTGIVGNVGARAAVVHADILHVEDAGWLRLYFEQATLERGSSIRITSLTDLEAQWLNATALELWNNTTAYFNGDTLLVELIAGPGTTRNRLAVSRIARHDPARDARGISGQCGICGNDDRMPSSENWTGRLLPEGCTASVWNTESCLVSAGHCVQGGDVIQFNVPSSTNTCVIVNPPVADQFPIIEEQHANGGVGNDWAVLRAGVNNLGQTPFDRYGQFRPISGDAAAFGQIVSMWGYGIDQTCARSQTQQTHSGAVTSVNETWFGYGIDLRGGNSGSALIRDGEIIGIATHCPCPNIATRMDRSNFAAARAAMCPSVWAGSEASLSRVVLRRGAELTGGTGNLVSSNDTYVSAGSDNSGNRKWLQVAVNLKTQVKPASATRLDLKIEYRLDIAEIPTWIELRNWATGGWTRLMSADAPTTDSVMIFRDIAEPGNYIRNNGQIHVRLTARKTDVAGMHLSLDEVEAVVYE